MSIDSWFQSWRSHCLESAKTILASEVNNVQKAIQTEVGVVICVTKALKDAGGFDGAVGEFEKICRYLIPLSTVLRAPMLIIGFEATKNISHY